MEINDINTHTIIRKMVVCVDMKDEKEDKHGDFTEARFIDVFVETQHEPNTHGDDEIIDIMINENGDCPKNNEEEKEIIKFVRKSFK